MAEEYDLEGNAQAAWETYHEEYKKRYGTLAPRIGSAPRTNKLYAAFYKLAKKCNAANVDIREYIVFCFATSNKRRIYITPNDFVGDRMLSSYLEFKAKVQGTLTELDFKRQLVSLAHYASMIDVYDSTKSILKCGMTPFYAWFRLFYFSTLDKELLSDYGAVAYNELRASRNLRDFLRKLRPDSFHEFEKIFGIFGD